VKSRPTPLKMKEGARPSRPLMSWPSKTYLLLVKKVLLPLIVVSPRVMFT